jgi:hypothetical protein
MRQTTILAKALAVVIASASLAVAAPIELVTNGDFETGSFTGWTVTDQAGSFSPGTWLIDTPGSLTPITGQLTEANPAGGSFYAVTDQGGPGTHSLTQTIVVPVSSQVVISFDYFVNDWSFAGPLGNVLDFNIAPTQFATADILTAGAGPFDTGAGVVANLLYEGGGTPPEAYTTFLLDITALVGSGGTFQLRFAESDNQLFLNFGLDNVSVLATPVPEPGTFGLLAAGLAAAVGSYRRRRAARR